MNTPKIIPVEVRFQKVFQNFDAELAGLDKSTFKDAARELARDEAECLYEELMGRLAH
tara:strand:+ start:5252 stop:5425 length:174 start_codon:yes stop_codon:yes gene_type:complete